ncbi:MAG: guanylate kinase [Candidatus Marinimicrobia bacterium]|nr:guanylate kinase [Candidatus Neomarinimicrobiota bacterium]
MTSGRLIVISAPSGTGKTTICQQLRERHPGWHFSVSATTRPMRNGETDGVDYRFLTDTEFDEKLSAGEFVEWERVHDHRYGTLVTVLEKALDGGELLLLDVDVKGGVRIKNRYPSETVSIFIEPPDEETLIERLKGRGTDGSAVIRRRLERIPEEMGYRDRYDHVVVNDKLEVAIADIENILKETA